jgi:hypothetical protein
MCSIQTVIQASEFLTRIQAYRTVWSFLQLNATICTSDSVLVEYREGFNAHTHLQKYRMAYTSMIIFVHSTPKFVSM